MKKNIAVVVTYNRKQLLKENIEALLMQSYKEFDIMIIDNASTDGTFAYIQSLIQKNNIIYFNTKNNLGGAGGFSLGIKMACEAGYEKIWIMDDDTIPEEDALQELMNVDKKLQGKYGFLASTVLWTDGTWSKMNLLRASQYHAFEDYSLAKDGIIGIERASFVSIMINATAVREVGLPIKEFFIWSDDQEYTDRISKKYSCYYVSKSKVLHKMKTNSGSNVAEDTYERIDRYRMAFRNEYYIARRNGTKKEYRGNVKGYILLILRTSKDYKFKRIKAVLSGVIQGWRFNPPIEYLTEKLKNDEVYEE